MVKKAATIQDMQLLDTPQVAKLLAVSVRTLEDWRLLRKGPAYVKMGRTIRYRLVDIQAWQQAALELVEPMTL